MKGILLLSIFLLSANTYAQLDDDYNGIGDVPSNSAPTSFPKIPVTYDPYERVDAVDAPWDLDGPVTKEVINSDTLAGCELSHDSQTISCPNGVYSKSSSVVEGNTRNTPNKEQTTPANAGKPEDQATQE